MKDHCVTSSNDSCEGDYGSPRYHNLVERSCINNHAMNASPLTANAVNQRGPDELTTNNGKQGISPSNVGRMGRDETTRKGP